MILTCPKCGDYYADAASAFCHADGSPLADLDPHADDWDEAVRVVEEKGKALHRRRRRLRWRRVLMSAMTMLVFTMIVCVVVLNSLIYLRPEREEIVAARLTQGKAPVSAVPTPTRSGNPFTRGVETTVVPLPQTEATPPPPGPASAEPTTPTGGTPTPPAPTPTATTDPTPPPPPPPPTPTPPAPTPEPTPTPTPTPPRITTHTPPPPRQSHAPAPAPAECSEADKSLERETIIGRFGDRWRRKIESDRRRIIAEHASAGVEIEASLGELRVESIFLKSCTLGFFTVRYVWQVRANFNGTVKVVPVAKAKRFACVKLGGVWGCS